MRNLVLGASAVGLLWAVSAPGSAHAAPRKADGIQQEQATTDLSAQRRYRYGRRWVGPRYGNRRYYRPYRYGYYRPYRAYRPYYYRPYYYGGPVVSTPFFSFGFY